MVNKLCTARVLVFLHLLLAGGAMAQTDPSALAPEVAPAIGPGVDAPEPRGQSNDQCFNALVLNGSVLTINFNTANNTTGVQGQANPNCNFANTTVIANDEWFTWVAPRTGIATLRSCGMTNVDTKAAVYQGEGCPQGQAPIACDDDFCGDQTVVTFPVVAGMAYTLQIGKFPGSPDGPGQFLLIGPGNGPPNDLCAGARVVEPGSLQFSNALTNTDGPAGACAPLGADLWYRFTSPAEALVRVSTCEAASFDTVLVAYTGGCSNLQQVACNDDACELRSEIAFNAVGGQTYLIRLAGYQAMYGSGVITITAGPPCFLECPPLSTPEGEPCGFDTNGGCNAEPMRALRLDCNARICGSLWATGGVRDTDWYRFQVAAPTTLNLSLVAELPATIFLGRFDGPCPNFQIITSASTPACGEPATIVRDVQPGQFGVVVVPNSFEGFPCGLSNAYTLSVNFQRPCPVQQPFFAGMRHTSLGIAQLELGSIIIGNTGSSGTNGAVVTVGATAEGWRGEGRVPQGPLEPGAAIVAAATGTVRGIADSTLGVARLDATQTVLSFTPDFSPISAATYRLEAFAGGTKVFSQAGRSGTAFTRANNGAINRMTFACVPEACANPPCPRTGPFVPVFECVFPFAAPFLVDNTQVVADRFVITPENPDAPITSISEVAITAASAEPLIFDAESLVFRRFHHTAQGDARFNASNGQLQLFNMDAANADGVRIEMEPDCARHVTEIASLGDPGSPNNPIPDGAFIEYRARGVLGGVSDALVSTSRYTDNGPGLTAHFDFSPAAPDSLTLVFLDEQGQVLGSEDVAGDVVEVEAEGGWIRTLEKTYDKCGQVVNQDPCWIPAAALSTPGGQRFQAVVLAVHGEPGVPFGGYTSAEIEFSDVPAVLIVDERVELSEGVCCACDFNGNSALNSQDFFDFLSCFFGGACPPGRTADFNADDVVNSQDFFDFLTCFFAPPKGCG